MAPMISIHFALTLLFGTVIGALAVLGSRATEIPAGLLPSLTTVAVGWWIHYTIRRQAELERVPLSYVSELSKRIDHLASLCLDTYLSLATTSQSSLLPGALSSNKGITELRKLANELHLFTSILDGSHGSRRLSDSLQTTYVEFKAYLTGYAQPDLVTASRASHRLRMLVLELHRHICRQILDHSGIRPVFRP